MHKTILLLLVLLSMTAHPQIATNTKSPNGALPKMTIDMLAYRSATSALENLTRYYKLKFEYDAERLNKYGLEYDWKQTPLVDVVNAICRKTRSKYYITNDGTIHIVSEKDNMAMKIEVPQNAYQGNPTKHNITVSGKIIDNQTGEALPFATVLVRGTDIGGSTNADGYFTLNKVPNDTCCIMTSYMGYQLNYFYLSPNISFQALKIELQVSSVTLNAVTVTGVREDVMQQKKEDISMIKMSPKKLEQLPNVGEKDIMRSFQLMPGVSAANESSSNLYVRGGTPDQNLVLYDGFTVYQVDHLYGFYSAFNSDAVKDVQLYKGGFESKFGGRLSSVTEITSKDGNQNSFNIGGGISLLSGNIFTEVPIGKKLTFLATARRSYKGPLYNKIFKNFQTNDNSSSAPSSGPSGMNLGSTVKSFFYDVNAKLTYRPSENDIVSLSFFNGSDKLDNGFKFETPSFMASQGINFNFSISDLTNYGNTGTSLKWGHKWGPKLYGNTLLTFSNYYSKRDRTSDGKITDNSGTEKTIKQGTLENNNLKDYSFKSDYIWNVTNGNKIEFGLFGTHYDIAYKYSQNDTSTIINKQDYGLLAGGYFQDKISLLKSKMILTPGIRFSYFDVTRKVYAEPRLASTYSIMGNLTAKIAVGRFYQFANRITREDILSGSRDFWILSNKTNIPVSSAIHYIGGLAYETNSLLFSAEAYYKTLSNLSEYSLRFNLGSPQQGAITYSENFFNGTGKAKGVEFLIQKKTGKFNGWVSYTLGQVHNRFDVYSANDYAASQDVTHELKAVALYKWKNFDFSATWIYATGKPYTAPSGAYSVSLLDGTTQDYFTTTSKNSLRLPDYHRLDLAVNYNLHNEAGNDIGYLGFSIFNVYNRTNVWYKQYQIVSGQIVETNINYLGLTPNLTLSLKIR